ncbi:MAG: alpha/beta hydrolase [Bryobacteraceae bacterium]
MAAQNISISEAGYTEGRETAGRRSVRAPKVLVIPGWNSSGEDHWQTIWERQSPEYRRVEQENWAEPNRVRWMERIEAELHCVETPVIFLAHSLGCIAVAHWAGRSTRTKQVAGAFLVAPPWIAAENPCTIPLCDFLPMPTKTLPFPSTLVTSESDPYISTQQALFLSRCWGAQLINVGVCGHINVGSGHGPWSQGRLLFEQFVNQVSIRCE